MKIRSMFAALCFAVGVASVAMPMEADALPVMQPDVVVGQTLPIEKSAYFYGGRRYCFYRHGWRGPGFYLCGRPFLRGFFFAPGFRGWGGYGNRRGFHRHGFRRGFHRHAFRHHGFRHHGFHHHGRHFGHFGGRGHGHFGGHHGHFGGHHGHFGGHHGHFGGHHGGGHHGGGHRH